MNYGPVGDSASPNRRRSGAPLKPLAKPVAVTVRTDEHGAPTYVRLPGKTARRVEAVRERWRIDDEWWRERISREYLAVILDDGRVLTLYHDLSDGRWFMQKD